MKKRFETSHSSFELFCFPWESLNHRNKKCMEVATEEFLKGRLVLLLEIERPLSISHVFSKQSSSFLSSCLHCFSLLWCCICILTHPFFFCLCLLGRFLYNMFSFFWLFFGCWMVSSVVPSILFIFRWPKCFDQSVGKYGPQGLS